MAYLPLVFFDHDGFASDGIDAEPTVCWQDAWPGTPDWEEAVRLGGPQLYGVPAPESP